MGERVNEFQELFASFTQEQACFKNSITLENDQGHALLNNENLLQSLERLISDLPEENKNFLAALMAHLRRISINETVNKMGLTNLQVVWSPTLQFGGIFTYH